MPKDTSLSNNNLFLNTKWTIYEIILKVLLSSLKINGDQIRRFWVIFHTVSLKKEDTELYEFCFFL